MHPNLFFVTVIVIFCCVRTSLGATDAQYTNCSTPLSCGNLQNIGYPFWGGSRPAFCGYGPGFELNCSSDAPQITIQSIPYRVLQITTATSTLVVARADLWTNSCPATLTTLRSTTLDTTIFTYATGTQDLLLYYGCISKTGTTPLPNQFPCVSNGNNQTFGIYTNSSSSSSSLNFVSFQTEVTVRVDQTAAAQTLTGSGGNLTQVLDIGFGLTWQANNSACASCAGSGGQCGSNSPSSPFVCYCSDGPSSAFTCQTNSTGNNSKNTNGIIGLPIAGAVLAGVGVGWALFSYRQRRSKRKAAEAGSQDATTPLSKEISSTSRTNFLKSNPSFPSSNSEYGKASTYFGVQVFSYTELEEATNNFDPSTQLGEGGFGTVYYGTLKDGRVVAVKRLFENNFKRVEQFMNEVEILTRLRHENLVTLFGCTSKRSRELLLVYEYISNGTLADHLHGKLKNSGLLTWSFRLNIAIETADALAYLHASEIIHRDVKTNNILLESDFRVKVADFGLSRLFPTDVTHVSTAPQGTPGYVDPEYYQCYQLTEKSDVYSFGVVLIELISSKQAVDTNRHRQEINLATMAINKIQNHTLHELVDPSLEFETNSSVRRMATLVAELAFRCLQMEKDMRPSMQEVLAALKGIKNEEPNAQAEEVDIVIEDGVGLSKENPPPMSPDSTATEKVTNSTTSNSGG